MLKQEESSHVLPQKYGGGPHGVGKIRVILNYCQLLNELKFKFKAIQMIELWEKLKSKCWSQRLWEKEQK